MFISLIPLLVNLNSLSISENPIILFKPGFLEHKKVNIPYKPETENLYSQYKKALQDWCQADHTSEKSKFKIAQEAESIWRKQQEIDSLHVVYEQIKSTKSHTKKTIPLMFKPEEIITKFFIENTLDFLDSNSSIEVQYHDLEPCLDGDETATLEMSIVPQQPITLDISEKSVQDAKQTYNNKFTEWKNKKNKFGRDESSSIYNALDYAEQVYPTEKEAYNAQVDYDNLQVCQDLQKAAQQAYDALSSNGSHTSTVTKTTSHITNPALLMAQCSYQSLDPKIKAQRAYIQTPDDYKNATIVVTLKS